ncbi:MAG: hypothetical protein ACM3WP_02525 [Acidobacteriota bacterium]
MEFDPAKGAEQMLAYSNDPILDEMIRRSRQNLFRCFELQMTEEVSAQRLDVLSRTMPFVRSYDVIWNGNGSFDTPQRIEAKTNTAIEF